MAMNLTTQIKLASLVVHTQELDPHSDAWEFDLTAMRGLADDAEVVEWLSTLDPAFLPEKRG